MNKVVIQLHGRDSVRVKGTTHVAQLVGPLLEGADPATNESCHQVFAA